mmetsp:Transcript_26422/g.47010  ORF Transcript_26422/g.47010 Transcript_26422/m.47010 type:complete len:243 (+) Transcript_26422:1007-1735(+)
MEFSTPRRSTIPFTTRESWMPPPASFATRTLSTEKFFSFSGQTSMHALAIRGHSTSSSPCCLLLTLPLMREDTSAASRMLMRSVPGITSVSRISSALTAAFSYPSAISVVCSPSRSSDSAFDSSSPARDTTRLVPSPISASCALAAMTMMLAAGCATSSSVIIVEVSLVTKRRSRWLITILFMPLGPSEVRVICANCLHASRFFTTASSTPERCLCPSFNIADSPYGCPTLVILAPVELLVF